MRKVAIIAAPFLLLPVLLINTGCGGTTAKSPVSPPTPTPSPTSAPAQPPMAAFIEDIGFGQCVMFTATNDGSGLSRVSDQPRQLKSVYVLPDGSKGVFAADTGDGNSQIFYLAPVSSITTPLQLTTTPENKTSPMLSADGSKITFVQTRSVQSDPEFVISDIVVMNADGSDFHVIEAPAGWSFSHPFFSPDGSKIAGAETTGWFGDYAIFTVNADGSSLTRLTPEGADAIVAFNPAFSSDGKQVVFDSKGWDDVSLYTMNTDGSALQRLGEQGSKWADPLFVGDRIMFLNNDEIYSMKPDGTDVKRVTNNAYKHSF